MTKNNLQEHCHTNNITKLEIQKKILYTQLSQYCSGCEIWGTFNTFSAKFRYGMQNLSFDQIYCKQKAELLHQKFCKYTKNQHILLFYQNLVDFIFQNQSCFLQLYKCSICHLRIFLYFCSIH
jgi:hypothetical protein